jgi:hypothetical protein
MHPTALRIGIRETGCGAPPGMTHTRCDLPVMCVALLHFIPTGRVILT